MKEIKNKALEELTEKMIYSDYENWTDDKTDTLYRWYQGNESESNIAKYVSLITYEEFKGHLDNIIKGLKED